MRRVTRQKEAILRILSNTSSHPTADQIYVEVKKEIPSISKGTVYRNLKILQESGEITELVLNSALGRYEVKQKNHYHFRCERCARVIDLDIPVERGLDRKVALRTGLKISGHQLEFRGVCRDCQPNIKNKRKTEIAFNQFNG
jgi:Fur family transcriptional regulator, peroxide stress response regulator